ncbi:hypothetical protein SDC9_145996 [bioreactor metagenome]|uniref:ACT domain-containing protein n=1 Tax=bioreactor metagenome TaxID=1076179 RepID=A0A645EAX4_9ZZZZ
MKAIVTAIGTDKKGIIAKVSSALYSLSINIMDINQTVMQEYFVMVMLVDLTDASCSFASIAEILDQTGKELNMSIRIQRQDIFEAMHRI